MSLVNSKSIPSISGKPIPKTEGDSKLCHLCSENGEPVLYIALHSDSLDEVILQAKAMSVDLEAIQGVGAPGLELELRVVVGGQVGLCQECDEAIEILVSVGLDLFMPSHQLHNNNHNHHSLLPACEVPQLGWNRLRLISQQQKHCLDLAWCPQLTLKLLWR